MSDATHNQLYTLLKTVEQKVDTNAQVALEFRNEVKEQHKSIETRLTEGSKQFTQVITKMEAHEKQKEDHEGRLRVLEKDMNRDGGGNVALDRMRNWGSSIIAAIAVVIAWFGYKSGGG